MESHCYRPAMEDFLTGRLSWVGADVRATLVDLGVYQSDPDHGTMTDVPVAARLSPPKVVYERRVAGGVALCGTVLFEGPPAGASASQGVVFHLGAHDDPVSRLIALRVLSPRMVVKPTSAGAGLLFPDGIFEL